MLDSHAKACYTTGEVAERCGITVRTVQYYDKRGLLHPTERTDGGRRLYDEDALARMRTICTLKELGLSLRAIRGVLESDGSDQVLRCLLEEQERQLVDELGDRQRTLDAVRARLAELDVRTPGAHADADTANDNPNVEQRMSKFFADKGTRLYRTQRKMLMEGIAIDLVELGCIYYGVTTGNWWPLAAAAPLIAIIVAELVWMYHRDARYVCPHCHETFQPAMREFFFATHTPKTRKLTCQACGKKDWCVEIPTPSN